MSAPPREGLAWALFRTDPQVLAFVRGVADDAIIERDLVDFDAERRIRAMEIAWNRDELGRRTACEARAARILSLGSDLLGATRARVRAELLDELLKSSDVVTGKEHRAMRARDERAESALLDAPSPPPSYPADIFCACPHAPVSMHVYAVVNPDLRSAHVRCCACAKLVPLKPPPGTRTVRRPWSLWDVKVLREPEPREPPDAGDDPTKADRDAACGTPGCPLCATFRKMRAEKRAARSPRTFAPMDAEAVRREVAQLEAQLDSADAQRAAWGNVSSVDLAQSDVVQEATAQAKALLRG